VVEAGGIYQLDLALADRSIKDVLILAIGQDPDIGGDPSVVNRSVGKATIPSR